MKLHMDITIKTCLFCLVCTKHPEMVCVKCRNKGLCCPNISIKSIQSFDVSCSEGSAGIWQVPRKERDTDLQGEDGTDCYNRLLSPPSNITHTYCTAHNPQLCFPLASNIHRQGCGGTEGCCGGKLI